MNRAKKRIPEMPHSIDAVARVLEVDKEIIVTWVLDGSIRACINYRTEYVNHLTYSVAVLGDVTSVIKQYKSFLNDESTVNCPLSKLLSTPLSKISIYSSSVAIVEKDSCISFSADLKGLWHINELIGVEELYDNTANDSLTYVNIVPYIPDAIYNSDVNEGMPNYLLGFGVEISFDDICISYEDILRVENYLLGKSELIALDAAKPCELSSQHQFDFTPTEQLSMAFVQLIISNPLLGSKFIENPHSSLKQIEYKLRDSKIEQLNSNDSTFSKSIVEGKNLLNPSNISMSKTSKMKPRKPYINKCKMLMQLIKIHPLIQFESIDEIDRVYEVINKILSEQSMSEFKITKEVFKYVFK